MKIYDCFTYFNEKELLELRIRLLGGVVDKFVVCEADHTHTGVYKGFSCRAALKELGLEEKVEVIELKLPNKAEEPDNWRRENAQRDALVGALGEGIAAFICDCDEIPNPEIVRDYVKRANELADCVIRLPMHFLMGRADLVATAEDGREKFWANAYICLSHHFKNHTLTQIRESFSFPNFPFPFKNVVLSEKGVVQHVGWHMSWMGDSERRKLKFRSFMHFEDTIQKSVGDKEAILSFMDHYEPEAGATDPMGRRNHCLRPFPAEKLPPLIFSHPHLKEFLLGP